MSTEQTPLETKLSPEQAQTVLDRDIVNIMEKVSAGKTLTDAERKKFEKLVKKARVGHSRTTPVEEESSNRRERNIQKEVRRNKVFELRIAGKTVREIAAILHCNKDTVVKDMDDLSDEFKKAIPPSKAGEFFKRQLETLTMLKRKAMELMETTEQDTVRLGCMNRIESITDKETKMLQDAGLLAVAPIKLEQTGANGGPIATVELPVTQDHLQEWLNGYVERKKDETDKAMPHV
jgi:hypothetical protein